MPKLSKQQLAEQVRVIASRYIERAMKVYGDVLDADTGDGKEGTVTLQHKMAAADRLLDRAAGKPGQELTLLDEPEDDIASQIKEAQGVTREVMGRSTTVPKVGGDTVVSFPVRRRRLPKPAKKTGSR